MQRDDRSCRVALVADQYVNPPPGGVDAVAAAAQTGWGVIQLPADDYPAAIARRLLFEVAEQAEEFARRGYDLVLVGRRNGLTGALGRAGISVPDRIIPESLVALVDFLNSRPSPEALRMAGSADG
jgi:hypothetical protein